MLELRARDALPARFDDHRVAVEHHVHIQGAVREPGAAAIAPVGILQRMQPLLDLRQRPIGLDHDGIVEKRRPVKSHRGGAVGRRDADRSEAFAQGGNRRGQIMLGLDIAAQAQQDGSHQRRARWGTRQERQ